MILCEKVVVICFKFSNFAYANTVLKAVATSPEPLLFALNLVTLLMQIQWHGKGLSPTICCYLL